MHTQKTAGNGSRALTGVPRDPMTLLKVTEAYTRSFCVLMGSNGDDFFVCEENETGFVFGTELTMGHIL